jgi:hypothetical protein
MFPDSTMPVRLIEYLIDEGLSRIAARIEAGDTNPALYLG